MEKNNSKIVRQYFKFQINAAVAGHKILNRGYSLDDIYKSLISMIAFTAGQDINAASLFNSRDRVVITMCTLQLYTDFYMRLRYLERMDLLDDSEEDVLFKVESIKSFSDLLQVLQEYPSECAVATLNFNDLPVYDKVLEIKALDPEDVVKISEFNPFFRAEYDNFNVTVDEYFMASQIKKWHQLYADPEKSYGDASDFLERYSIIDGQFKNSLKEKYPGANLKEVVENFYSKEASQLELKP